MQSLPLYDLSEIQSISRGNNDFVLKMLKMFIDYTPSNINDMKEKYASKDFVGLGEVAHMIKPTIDSMHINSLKETIREIEKTGKEGKDNDGLPALLQKVENDMDDVITAIKKEFDL